MRNIRNNFLKDFAEAINQRVIIDSDLVLDNLLILRFYYVVK